MDKMIKKMEDLFSIEIESYELINGGQNNKIIIVNRDTIFRIPKFVESMEQLKKQVKHMKLLESLPIEVPRFKYQNLNGNLGEVMVGYSLIEGKQLLKERFETFENKVLLANQLGGFLKVLHSIEVPESTEMESIDPRSYYEKMYWDIENLLFEYMSKESKEEVTRLYSRFLEEVAEVTLHLIHGDFGPTNILFEESGITGIIDFDSLHIGDPAIDFASLMGPYGYGEPFVRLMEKSYGPLDDLIKRAQFYRQTFALEDALFGIRNNDLKTFEFGIRGYR